MKQVDIAELLDTDSGTAEEIADSLLDICAINRRFGGISTMEAMVERVSLQSGSASLTVLEVAAGSGCVPRTAGERLQARGIKIEVTLLDRVQSHLPTLNGPNGGHRRRAVVGDALALPFSDSSFDLVDCNLFAHHLPAVELIKFVTEALRVCRMAVLINDIVRSPIHLALVYAASRSFRSRLTRHDAVVSVRRAFTSKEMRALLAEVNATRVEIRHHFLYRMAAIAWKHAPAA